MTTADLATVLQLESELFSHPWSEQAFIGALAAGHLSWMLESDDQVAGYLICSRGGGEADLLQVAVAARFQRQGYGQWLLSRLFDTLSTDGIGELYLEVRAGNRPALSCYNRAGFVQVGVRRNYYRAESGREDAVMMKMVLGV